MVLPQGAFLENPIRLEILPRFKKARKGKTPALKQAIDECVQLLSEDPYHPGLHTHRVQGRKGVWEAYVDRTNRITFQYGENSIILRNNCNHDVPGKNP